jgi:hypothetical protein
MLKRLLYMIKEPNTNSLNENTLKHILSTIKILLLETTQSEDVTKFGQYLASLLPDSTVNEKLVSIERISSAQIPKKSSEEVFELASPTSSSSVNSFSLNYTIKLRNKLLAIVDEVVSQNTSHKTLNFQEDLQRLLGYDWFLLFMQPHVHKTTLITACKILFSLLLNIQNLNRFKDSSVCGGWLSSISSQSAQAKPHSAVHSQLSLSEGDAASPTTSRPAATMASQQSAEQQQQLASRGDSSANLLSSHSIEVNMEACSAPGFQIMQAFFARNADTVELYYLLFALLLDAQRIKELPLHPELDLNSICKYVFDKSFDSEQSLFCKINTDVSLDVALILFSMIRTLMNPAEQSSALPTIAEGFGEAAEEISEQSSSSSSKTKDYAIILLQIFRFMYHNSDEFRSMASNADFLSSLIATLYPYADLTQKEQATPVSFEIKPFAEAICENKGVNYKSYLAVHPARKLVMDFLRDLLYDGLLNSSNPIYYAKGSAIIDLILVSLPDTNAKRNQEFVTELFKVFFFVFHNFLLVH